MPFNEVDTALSCGVIPVFVAGNGHCNFKNWFIAILGLGLGFDMSQSGLAPHFCLALQLKSDDIIRLQASQSIIVVQKEVFCVRLAMCVQKGGWEKAKGL